MSTKASTIETIVLKSISVVSDAIWSRPHQGRSTAPENATWRRKRPWPTSVFYPCSWGWCVLQRFWSSCLWRSSWTNRWELGAFRMTSAQHYRENDHATGSYQSWRLHPSVV